jgi:hypothetical protein
MRGRYQTRPVPSVRIPAAAPRVVRAESSGALVTLGPLKGERVASLTGYHLEDVRDWTRAELHRTTDGTRKQQLKAQAEAI